MFILKKGHQPGVYVPLRALFLVVFSNIPFLPKSFLKSTFGDVHSYLIWLISSIVFS